MTSLARSEGQNSEALFSHKITRNELKPGDHIYSWRVRGFFSYSHHGIYVGDGDLEVIDFGTVVNSTLGISSSSVRSLASHCVKCGDKVRVDGVRSSCLDCFLCGGILCRYQYGVSLLEFQVKIRGMCTMAGSDPASAVIHRAKYLLEKNGFGEYNLKTRNCEDFSRYCTTGLIGIKSSQIACFSAVKRSGFSVKKYLMHRVENDISVNNDVEKFPVEELVSRRLYGFGNNSP